MEDVALGRGVGYAVRYEDVSDPMSRTHYVDRCHHVTFDGNPSGAYQGLEARGTQSSCHVWDAGCRQVQEYFYGAPIIKVPGRTFPVEVFYTVKPERNYVEAAVRTTVHAIHQRQAPGDILVFLTGEQEIEQACEEIREKARSMGAEHGELVAFPLCSSLSPEQHSRIFSEAPGPRYAGGPPGRKVVVATNIAETSFSIYGIVYAVDPGFSKQKYYNPRIRAESLLASPVSRASA